MRFRRARQGVELRLHVSEADLLTNCVQQLVQLLAEPPLGPGQPAPPDAGDPLAELVGISGPAEPPADPALARLLPDAYRDDPAAAADFRRYTDKDLRAGKRAAAEKVLADLAGRPSTVLLDQEAAHEWLSCVNDLRLVLGTRLGVTEETDYVNADPADPDGPALNLYGWLSWAQESLVSCLLPKR